MKQNKGTIGIKEYIALVILTVGAKLSDDTPAILFENAKNAGWIAVALIGLLSVLPILFMLKVFSVHREKNLHEIILHLFGKFIGNIVSVLLLFGGVFALIVDSGISTDIISSFYFTKTPPIIVYSILMMVCAYGAKRGFEHIGTAAWLLLPYVKITLFIVLLFSFGGGTFGFIYPLWGEGMLPIIKTVAKDMSIYADFLYIGLVAPLVTSFKVLKKGTIWALAIVTFEICIAMVAFVMLFDYTTAEMLAYPFHETIRYIHIGFLSNVETFFFPFWLVATFIRFSFYLYLSATLLGGILKIKEFEYLIPLLTVIVILLGVAPESPSITLSAARKMNFQLLTPAFFVLPPLMWILAKIRGDFKNETA